MADTPKQWLDDSPVVQRLAALPCGKPADPDKRWKEEANRLNMEAFQRAAYTNGAQGVYRLTRVDWRTLKAEHERTEAENKRAEHEKEDRAAEIEAGKVAHAAATNDTAATLREIARLEKKLYQVERRNEADARQRQVDALALARAARKGRTTPNSEDTSWAIREFNRSWAAGR